MSKNKDLFSKSELKELLEKKNSCVVLKNAVIEVFLVPCYLSNVVAGLKHALNKKLKTYDSKLEGIILGFDNIKVNLSEGRFAGKCAEILYPVSCNAYVFQPIVGSLLEGIVNRTSDDHVGCVCLKYFNAMIKRKEDESFEYWKNRRIYINQSITLRVKELDYTGLIPCIEGDFDGQYKYTPELRNGSSESGIEDMRPTAKKTKKKRDRVETVVNSTKLLSAQFSDNCSDSGLDFDLLSPITGSQSPFKDSTKKRKSLMEPSNSPKKKKKSEELDTTNPDELRQRLLQEQLTCLQLDFSEESTPVSKKRKKDAVDSPKAKKAKRVENVPSGDVTPIKNYDMSYDLKQSSSVTACGILKVAREGMRKEIPQEKSPVKEHAVKTKTVKNSPAKVVTTCEVVSDSTKLPKEPKKPHKPAVKNLKIELGSNTNKQELTEGPGKKEKSSKKSPKKKNSTDESAKIINSLLESAMNSSISPDELVVQKSKPAAKKPRKPAEKKPKVKQDPAAKKMAFYLKKLKELASQQSSSSLLENMMKSLAVVKKEDIT